MVQDERCSSITLGDKLLPNRSTQMERFTIYRVLAAALLIITLFLMFIYENIINNSKQANIYLLSQTVTEMHVKTKMVAYPKALITVGAQRIEQNLPMAKFSKPKVLLTRGMNFKRRPKNIKTNFQRLAKKIDRKAQSWKKTKIAALRDNHEKSNVKSQRYTAKRNEQNVCNTWKYNTQDWTLIYNGSKKEYENVYCPTPPTKRKVKRITFRDGEILNIGCNNHTEACKEGPFYDFKTEKRINTPPCCRSHVLHMFMHVTEELQTLNISHCMISGGVIGWVRNQKMVPYDRDLDLIIDVNFWNSTQFWLVFKRLHNKYGYVPDLVENFKLKLYLSTKNKNNIDIWAYWLSDGELSIAYHRFKEQNAAIMLPFKNAAFEWFHTYLPANPVKYLNKQYGREIWRPEKQCMVRNEEGDCW